MEHCCKCQLPGSHCQLEWPSVFTLPRKLHRLTQHTSEDVRPYCSLLMTIQPLLSVLLPFAPVSCFQMSPSYDETLTSLSWALDFPGPLCGAGLPMTHPVKAWAGSKRWAGECLWASWRDWTRGKLRRFPSLVTGSGWKEPRAQNHSEWIILECNVRSCLPLYPQDPEHSGCRVNTWWMPIVASCLYGPNTEPPLGAWHRAISAGLTQSHLCGPDTEPSLRAWHRAVSRGLTSSPRPPSALFTDCCGALAGCLLLREELRLRNGGKASPVAGLHWLPRAWLSSQVQSTLCVMNDIETYPWQPAGPSPDLCKHQPEAALVLRQPGDSPSQPRFFRPPAWDDSYLSSCVSAPDTGGWILCGFPSEDLGRKCHSLSSLCLSLFALAETTLWSSLLRSHRFDLECSLPLLTSCPPRPELQTWLW